MFLSRFWVNGEGRKENFRSLEVRGKLIALKKNHALLVHKIARSRLSIKADNTEFFPPFKFNLILIFVIQGYGLAVTCLVL